LVQQGTLQADYGFTQTYAVTTVGTSPVHFVQFTGSSVLTAGVGLAQTGNVLSVLLGAGVTELDTGNVGLDLYNAAGGNGAIILTTDGLTHSTSNASKLFLLLDSGSGLVQSATGLKINAASVTNAMLTNPSITLNSDGGTATLALGGTLEIKGTSTQGISTSNAGDVVTITAANASASQKGVATFNTGDFLVTAGDVTIKAAGVDNAQLVNQGVTITGTTGSDAVNLGESFAIIGGTAPITTVMGTNSLSINVAPATTSALGLANFPAVQFSVASGAVTIATTLGQGALTNVAAAVDIAANNDVLVYNSTSSKWENHTPATVGGTIALGDLSDVDVAAPSTSGQILVANGTKWNAKSAYFLYSGASNTTHTVTHGLGTQYCNVTVIDAGTDEQIIPNSVVFGSTTALTVTLNTALAIKVVVMGIA
jgi:hypothetical protein